MKMDPEIQAQADELGHARWWEVAIAWVVFQAAFVWSEIRPQMTKKKRGKYD